MTGHFLHQDLLGSNVTIRSAGTDDRRLLRRLAALDSSDAPVGDVLLAEVDGEPRVALELRTGRFIADPFHRSEPQGPPRDSRRDRARADAAGPEDAGAGAEGRDGPGEPQAPRPGGEDRDGEGGQDHGEAREPRAPEAGGSETPRPQPLSRRP
jgi:hypothetical protein